MKKWPGTCAAIWSKRGVRVMTGAALQSIEGEEKVQGVTHCGAEDPL